MDWVAVLGAVGAVTGGFSFVFTVYAWRTERAERRADVAAEREARLAEIAIERERADAEQRERQRQRRANITATQLPHKRTREGERVYKFKLRNMGPSYSKHVRAWLQAEDRSFRQGIPLGIPLDVGEEAPIDFAVPRELWERSRPPLKLVLEWFNDEGEPERETSNLQFDYDR